MFDMQFKYNIVIRSNPIWKIRLKIYRWLKIKDTFEHAYAIYKERTVYIVNFYSKICLEDIKSNRRLNSKLYLLLTV